MAALRLLLRCAVVCVATALEKETKFDWMEPETWSPTAQYVFAVTKLCFAFSPILALLAVFYVGWETDEEEKLKRQKKADFTFDSPE